MSNEKNGTRKQMKKKRRGEGLRGGAGERKRKKRRLRRGTNLAGGVLGERKDKI